MWFYWIFVICWSLFWPYCNTLTSNRFETSHKWHLPWPSCMTLTYHRPTIDLKHIPDDYIMFVSKVYHHCSCSSSSRDFCLVHTQIKSHQSLSHVGHPIPTESTSQSTLKRLTKTSKSSIYSKSWTAHCIGNWEMENTFPGSVTETCSELNIHHLYDAAIHSGYLIYPHVTNYISTSLPDR